MVHIDGSALKRMIINAAAAVENNKQSINELNVFPVPDGDTGTNMSLTILAASNDLSQVTSPDIGVVADVVARAMVRGARGNSGVILSLLFRGFSKRLKDLKEIDGAVFAEAMQNGVESAYKAVMKPAEGTMLTVSRVASARALEVSKENSDPEYVLSEMLLAAEAALEETINQNPVLQKAGVIDAGGKGFCIILDAMLRSLKGETITSEAASARTGSKQAADFSDFETSDI